MARTWRGTKRTNDHGIQAVIVLGAANGPALARRARYGARLVRLGRAPRLLAVGGGTPSEAETIAALAREAGVPDAAILCERNSLNTRDNAIYSAGIMRAQGLERALLVTDWPHMPRALACFRLAGIRCHATPVPRTAVQPLFWLREACASVFYLGRIRMLLRARRESGRTRPDKPPVGG